MLFRRKIYEKKLNINSLQAFYSLFPPKNKTLPGGKVSAGTSQRASLTVESAFVLPLFFLCLCTLISFMDIYKLQTEKLTQLCRQAKDAGTYAYITDVKEDITLPLFYAYKAPISVVPLPRLIMTNQITLRPWTGVSRVTSSNSSPEEMVYVTANGGVYHTRSQCTHLSLNIQTTSTSAVGGLRNQYGEKYKPCQRCTSGTPKVTSLYITTTGNRYHAQPSCSGLKRTVRLVKKSQLTSMNLCSRCALY